MSGLVWRSAALGWSDFWAIATDRRTLKALEISFGASLIAAAVNVVFGTIVAWVLVRYNFPGRRIVDAMVDLPFALPTAVAGIALTTLYAPNGWIGALLAPLGIKVAYTPLGIIIALVFIGLPFVVRTVQPVMEEIDKERRGSGRHTRRNAASRPSGGSCFPGLAPAIVTGFALAFARAVGEYGSVIFIAGNLPFMSGDRAAADRHQARGVQLCRRHRDRHDHAGACLSSCCWSSTSCSRGAASVMADGATASPFATSRAFARPSPKRRPPATC